MRLLLDTQALVWWRQGSKRLGPRARRAIGGATTNVHVSAASAWELAIKSRLAQFDMRERLSDWLPRALDEDEFVVLDITLEHALAVSGLPFHHVDPFDRLLVAQAQLEGLTVVTSDSAFEAYDVQVLDARR